MEVSSIKCTGIGDVLAPVASIVRVHERRTKENHPDNVSFFFRIRTVATTLAASKFKSTCCVFARLWQLIDCSSTNWGIIQKQCHRNLEGNCQSSISGFCSARTPLVNQQHHHVHHMTMMRHVRNSVVQTMKQIHLSEKRPVVICAGMNRASSRKRTTRCSRHNYPESKTRQVKAFHRRLN